MKIYNSIEALSLELSPQFNPTISIGNFDGAHLGHHALFAKAKSLSKQQKTAWGVLTFAPHPRDFFKGTPSEKLFSPSQKIRGFQELGADFLCIQPFDSEFANLTPEEFCGFFKTDHGVVNSIVVGHNFRFGKNRQGSPDEIKKITKGDVKVEILNSVSDEQTVVSTSYIKSIINNDGNVGLAAKLLGRPYCLWGVVHQGKQLGRTIGVPTANVTGVHQLIPKPGVYAGYAVFQNEDYPELLTIPKVHHQVVVNIGQNPTVAADEHLKIEAHILKNPPSESLYGKTGAVYLLHRLRDEMKFESLEKLKVQITQDIGDAEKLLKDSRSNTY